MPDFWLDHGNPWEIERVDLNFKIRFYGDVKKVQEKGKEISVWEGGETIHARPYDNPIPGTNNFRNIFTILN